MILTADVLKKHMACADGFIWYMSYGCDTVEATAKKLMDQDKFTWANWLLSKTLSHAGKIKYAVFSAECVIKIYDAKYPGDDRPRKAIDAAKKYIKNKTKKNAAYAAYAADAADAAASAAAYAADAAASAAAYAAYAADAAASAAADAVKKQIIEHGIKLILEES